MNDLPNEIVLLILSKVDLAKEGEHISPSELGGLYRCSRCVMLNRECFHIHPLEVKAAMNIRCVCKLWNSLICSSFGHYVFWI